MKKIMIIFLAVLFCNSCYKDLSTETTTTIPEIVIDGIDKSLEVVFGQNISMTAKVTQEGRSEEDFDYLWEMDILPQNAGNREILSETNHFEMQVSRSPSNIPYIITLTVTDNLTGLKAYEYCKLYVSSSLEEGLIVAYTHDEGKTTELGILSNKHITYGYKNDGYRVTKDLFSIANSAPLKGRVNAIVERVSSNGAVYNETRILVGTDEHLLAIDPLTFKVSEKDGELFNNMKDNVFKTTSLFNFAAYQSSVIVNGRLYVNPTLVDNSYTKCAYPLSHDNVFKPENLSYAALSQGFLAVFDEDNSKFLNLMGPFAQQAGFSEITSPSEFDIEGAKSIGAGESREQRNAFLLKDASGLYHIVIYDRGESSYTHYNLESENLKDAISIAFCDNCDLMYFATKNKIYAVVMSAGKATPRTLNWKPDTPSERITSIRQYHQAWYGTRNYSLSGETEGGYPFPLETNRLQMIITTYNESSGEGKIYLRPFNLSTGLFTFKDNGSYGGFGQITAIAPIFK